MSAPQSSHFSESYERFSRLVEDQPLPCALVDLDAVDRNVEAITSALGGCKKKIRIATKSIRCPDLVRYVAAKLGAVSCGLMTYTASETAFWAREGFTDLLLAYPKMASRDAELLARVNQNGAVAAVVVDCEEHLVPLAAAARAAETTIPVVVEIENRSISLQLGDPVFFRHAKAGELAEHFN
ncbi:MAG: alanine racemase, partial [Polyangiaceae bacterium]